jgi:hypothetical protein
MKRKLIQNLLQTETDQLDEEVLRLLPGDGEAEADPHAAAARLVLKDALAQSRKAGLLDAPDFYFRVCSSAAAQLTEFLQGTDAGNLNKGDMARSQAILNELLTSKAGRKKASDLSRHEQLAVAQQRRRERNQEEGRKRLNVWISPEAAAYLDAIQAIHNKDSQAAALELVLEAAMKGQALQRKI